MELLTGYLWEISGEYERQNEVSGEFTRQSREKFVIYKEGASSAWYCLTETEEKPKLEWGDCSPFVPAEVTIGQPLAVLDADGYAGYTAWVASADGITNECVILAGDC